MGVDVLLIGQEHTKRSDYFISAASALGYKVRIVAWDKWQVEDLKDARFVKLDPATYTEANITHLPRIIAEYYEQLNRLQMVSGICFLNHPKALGDTLDKVNCKRILMQNNIPTTPLWEEKIASYEELKESMLQQKQVAVFIKPRYGSGAAGVMAYRYHPLTKEEILYTSMRTAGENQLYNTKKMKRITTQEEIKSLIDGLFSQEVIIEKWVQKAKYKDLSYDLRVVYQFGNIDFVVARGSQMPITNLHLNNCALSIEKIGLADKVKDELFQLCEKTMACFKGFNTAGIDVLITPKGKVMVIEVNGQGDLIYQDIFKENKIYKEQMRGMISKYGQVTL